MEQLVGNILVGVSSWSDAALVDSGFYPPEVRSAAQRLSYYGGRFAVAEVDSTYHFFATAGNLRLWLDNSPDNFKFNIKAFSLFTLHPTPFASLPKGLRETHAASLPARDTLYLHHLPKDAAEDLWRGFAGTVERFHAAGKLGVVLFQFPPYFHPSEASLKHIEECRHMLPRYPLAVEFRVGTWLSGERRKETLDFLGRLGISLVCVDEPQGFRSSLPPESIVTSSPAVVRFHGRNAANWETKGIASADRFDYLYSRKELEEWLPRIRAMADVAADVHVIFKNKHSDYPVRNALEMIELLQSG